ncbi:MAG: hypothetical protein NDI81_03315 [Desulfobacula sp.]|nr:hypothetical protein [Desulfobacula sp.]MDA8136759.1 hypothetical protein [Desulfobacteraceae bacterium]
MKFQRRHKNQFIMDLELLNLNNASGCAACNEKFSLGDSVVLACGGWADGCFKIIHENEAIFDKKTDTFFERIYYSDMRA